MGEGKEARNAAHGLGCLGTFIKADGCQTPGRQVGVNVLRGQAGYIEIGMNGWVAWI